MDVKAMARSKRSHTKHHQPRKPHRPNTQSTTSSSSSSSSKDPKVLKDEGERKKSNLGSSLPSNWSRYYDSDDDEGLFGSDSESAGGLATDATKTDVVKPKSKGADFGFLISEAMSQSSASFSSTFDDMLPDFSQGLESMLSVRGENILSWTGSDNFLMEDEAATSNIFCLNLQTLAEELARIDLAQRLFIEEDILPPELRAPQKVERESPMHASSSVDDLAFQHSSKVEERTESKGHSLCSDCVDTSNQTPFSFRQKGQLDDSITAHESDSFRVLDPKESFKATQKAEIEEKMPKFEAGAAETELDMLLDSFNETTFFGSSNVDSTAPIAAIEQRNSATSNDSTHLDSSKSSLLACNMDNDIDELLQETSVGFAISHSTDLNVDSISKQLSLSSTQPGTKSKVMEDFDSWLDTIGSFKVNPLPLF